MKSTTITLGIRKFRVPEENARLINLITSRYESAGIGSWLIVRHLIGFSLSDLLAFLNWQATGQKDRTRRFESSKDFEHWNEKFHRIAAEIKTESKLGVTDMNH
ncbi:hypothetical protein [Desulfomonile tiedjei]|uniref:Uncharacterized protein n=1 Tax=Desulfomonile tiedjei (strain ATCC 49306 / DSM 6799 / DCB-1) TaxID=706587 RepID=I4CCZ4_DESTA|nr:hypothetical protein [Desulfomonile tiedjei]AFM27435.1 hypothetical protein Desti_4819 [Desulfomonile tiedjei DSM 6799]